VEDHAADQLNVEVALADRALAGLTGERERLRKQVVERLAVQMALAERLIAGLELLVRVQLELGLVVVDAGDDLLEGLELLSLTYPQRAIENGHPRDGSKGTGALWG
jgi:hypothetical protein